MKLNHTADVYLKRELILGVLESLVGSSFLDVDEKEDFDRLLLEGEKIEDALNFEREDCEDIYDLMVESELSGYLLDEVEEEVRTGSVRGAVWTGIRPDFDHRYLETESIAIPVTGLPGLWIGFTHYYGGGEHSEPPGAIDWWSGVYLVKSEKRIQTVEFFQKITSAVD